MKRRIFLIIIVIFLNKSLYAGLLINEVVSNASSDWVELYFSSDVRESLDISPLYVTMYYGTNESLGTEPITLYSYDRPETSYDDRYCVIHPAEPETSDETDSTGDTNGNGILDIYCNNYYASFWNSDCVVAIDEDDDPSNGGILDFVAYSNRDGSPNKTMESYIVSAAGWGQWQNCDSGNIQECSVDIGEDGLASHMSLSRKGFTDTNTIDDFSVSSYQTPGRPNINIIYENGDRLIKRLKKKISVIPYHNSLGEGNIPLFVYQMCNIKLQVFTVTGRMIHESPGYTSVNPGLYSLKWNPLHCRQRIPTGLYIGKIEATSSSLHLSENKIVYLIVGR